MLASRTSRPVQVRKKGLGVIKGKRQWDQVLMVSLVRVALHNRNPDQHICCWGTAGVWGGGHGSAGGWWVPEIWRWGMGGWGGGRGGGGLGGVLSSQTRAPWVFQHGDAAQVARVRIKGWREDLAGDCVEVPNHEPAVNRHLGSTCGRVYTTPHPNTGSGQSKHSFTQ